MDTNLMSCAKCGHSVSETAKACAYCGAVVAPADAPPQPDTDSPQMAAQSAEPQPVPADDSQPVLDMTDESAAKPEKALSSQVKSEEIQTGTNETVAPAVSDADDQIDFQLPDEELIVELNTEETTNDMEQTSDAAAAASAIKKPELNPDATSDPEARVALEKQAAEAAAEVIPLADKVSAKAASDDSPDFPPAPVLEVNGEDPSESETLGADILELVQIEASGPESIREQAAETARPPAERAGEKKAAPATAPLADGSDNKDGEPEAILLASDEEVQSAAPSLAAGAEEAVDPEASEKPVDLVTAATGVAALKIEKAGQDLAEAQKKQKAVSDANGLKKQKAALARAEALKKKKLKLAKVQALKRKKAAMVKAQALKKQKEAQADKAKASTEMAAGSKPPKADNPTKIIQSMEANAKILGLLKKYEGQTIGINYDNSADIKEAELVEANDEFFSVFVKDKELNYSHPLKTILTIIEGQDGVETGKPEQKAKFNAVIKVYPLVLF